MGHDGNIVSIEKKLGELRQVLHNLVGGNLYVLSLTLITIPENQGATVQVLLDELVLKEQLSFLTNLYHEH